MRTLLADPLRRAEVLRSYSAGGIALGVAVPAALSLFPLLAQGRDRGVPLSAQQAVPFIVWALVAAHLPTMLWTRRLLIAGDARWASVAYLIQSQVQLAWVLLLSFHAAPSAPHASTAMLSGMVLGWAYNDASLAHDVAHVRIQYLVAFAGFAVLLGLNQFVFPGQVLGRRPSPGDLGSFAAAVVILGTLTQLVIFTVGDLSRARAQAQAESVALRLENERMTVEQLALRRVSGLLASGVSAGQYSHDAANPLAVLSANLQLLDEQMQAADAPRDPDVAETLREAILAAETLTRLHETAIATIRSGGERSPLEVSALVDDSLAFATEVLRQRHRRTFRATTEVEPGVAMCCSLHAQAIGNLVVNGVLQDGDDARIEVSGTRDGERYELRIRDHGIAPDAREARIRAMQRSFSLVDEGAPATRTSAYPGFGLGLILARTLLVSTGGSMHIEAPGEGRGLIICVTLPLAPTSA
ncbi:MAG: ATP-binding protein [Polyangiales bacterium]